MLPLLRSTRVVVSTLLVLLLSLSATAVAANPAPDEYSRPGTYPEDMSKRVQIYVNHYFMLDDDSHLKGAAILPVPYVAQGSGETLIPAQLLAHSIGGQVDWRASDPRITLKMVGKTAVMKVGDPTATVDGQPFPLAHPPVVRLNVLYVPLRIVEAFGAQVDFWMYTDPARANIISPDFICTNRELCFFTDMSFEEAKIMYCDPACYRARDAAEKQRLAEIDPATAEIIVHDTPDAYKERTSRRGMRAICRPSYAFHGDVEVLEETEESQYDFEFAQCYMGDVMFGEGAPDCGYRDAPELAPFWPDDLASSVYVWVNGVNLHTPEDIPCRYELDNAHPYVVQGSNRTILPVRFFVEALGGQVEWEAATRQVTMRLNGKTVRLRIDDAVATLDGRRFTLDQPPVIRSGRTFVPLRFVMEAFGGTVSYHKSATAAAVLIDLPGVSCSNRVYCDKNRRPDDFGVHL